MIQLGGVDVEPEEAKERADDGEAETGQKDLALNQGDGAVGGKGGRARSTRPGRPDHR